MTNNQDDYIGSLEYDISNYLGSIEELVGQTHLVNTGPDDVRAIAQDYRDFKYEFNLDPEQAALLFIQSAGKLASENLDRESDEERLFDAIRRALSSEKARRKIIIDRVRNGDWVYEGVTETELREAYENMEPSP